MKKIITSIIIILFTFSFASSQETKETEWGVKGGLTLSHMNLDIPKAFSTSVNYGGHLSLYANFGKSSVTFQPELMFIQKGSVVNDDFSNGKMHVRSNYIDVPLLCRVNVDIGKVPYYFTAGPYIGVLISEKTKFENMSTKYAIDLTPGSIDAGIVMSMGIYVNKLLIELRAACGLVNQANKDTFYDDSRNNYINISVGYKIK